MDEFFTWMGETVTWTRVARFDQVGAFLVTSKPLNRLHVRSFWWRAPEDSLAWDRAGSSRLFRTGGRAGGATPPAGPPGSGC